MATRLTSPLTGGTVSLTDEKEIAAHLAAGWLDAENKPQKNKHPDQPDVEAGREALAAQNGAPSPKSAKKAAPSKPAVVDNKKEG